MHCGLRKHPRQPWELIAIDNGSTDHTDVCLAGVRDGASVPVTLITNATNRGFPAAINQGLKAARGEYLVLMNNDVAVTDGWLDQLIALANAKRGITTGSAESEARRRRTTGKRDLRTSRVLGREILARPGLPCPPPLAPPSQGGERCCTLSVNGTADETGNLREADPSVPTAYCPPPSAGCAPPTANCLLATVPTIGLVGPMSNNAAPPQRVEGVPYRDLRRCMPLHAGGAMNIAGNGSRLASCRGFVC